MKIKVFSRIEAQNYVPPKNSAIISIGGTFEEELGIIPIFHSNFEYVLRLKFDDIDKEINGLILFNDNHCQQIFNFCKIIPEINFLGIHCAAGISRSAAVGIFIDKYFCNNSNDIISKKPFYNRYVLRKLEENFQN